jgi:hypothetical protein
MRDKPNARPAAGRLIFEVSMPHKYNVGASVYFQGGGLTPGARGAYKVLRQLPVERDNRLTYRIKNVAENFERIADEEQLSKAQ